MAVQAEVGRFVRAATRAASMHDYAVRRSIGLSLFFFSSKAVDDAPAYDLLMRCVDIADREGFDAVWIPERHFSAFGELFPNPAVLGAAIAARTRRLAIRAGSVVGPLHDPLRLVEEWSMVDNLSAGRVGLSFASGWHPNDFVLAPGAYATRKERNEASIRDARALWAGEGIVRTNGAGDEVTVYPRPRPCQATLPIWLTVTHADGFRRAAMLRANVLTGMMDLSEAALAAAIAAYRRSHVAADEAHVTVMLHTYIDDVPGRAEARSREPLGNYLGAYLAGGQGAIAQRPDAGVLQGVSNSDRAAILGHMADRYLSGRSMIGTTARAKDICGRMADIGVDEIACLVDFGLPADAVLEGVERLAKLRHIAVASKEQA